jgi:hypothetical protein
MKLIQGLWQRMRSTALSILALSVGVTLSSAAFAGKTSQSGTTLQAYKTIDICSRPDGKWLYSGEVSVWNEGTSGIATEGLSIYDCIQNKTSGPNFIDKYCAELVDPPGGTVIPAGTDLDTATTFPFSFVGDPLPGTVRNAAKVTITNHSGHLGTPLRGPVRLHLYAGLLGQQAERGLARPLLPERGVLC